MFRLTEKQISENLKRVGFFEGGLKLTPIMSKEQKEIEAMNKTKKETKNGK